MRSRHSFPEHLSQHRLLPIRIVSPAFGHLSPEAAAKQAPERRLSYYFFLFMMNGAAQYSVDLNPITIKSSELLFSLPHQIQELPVIQPGSDYYKLGFDEECLSRLPRQYPFLLNPFNLHKISVTAPAAVRLGVIFSMLTELLKTPDADPELITAHLNSLLTEINAAYFTADNNPADERMDRYIRFKVFVESNLASQPSVKEIAAALALSTDSLYQLVKHYSGLSPKEFITNRLILEARRLAWYGRHTSVKELAFELGFNDPDYFSRLFKKVTGKTVAGFIQDLS